MRVSKGAFNTLGLRQGGMRGMGFGQRVREITQMINGRSTAGANLIPHNYPCKCDRHRGGGAGMLNWRSLIGLFVLSAFVLGDCGSYAAESLSAGEKPVASPKHLTRTAEEGQVWGGQSSTLTFLIWTTLNYLMGFKENDCPQQHIHDPEISILTQGSYESCTSKRGNKIV